METNVDSKPTALPQTGQHYQIPVLRAYDPREIGGPLAVADGTLDHNSFLVGRSGVSSYIFGVKSNEFLDDAIVAGDKLLVETAIRASQKDLIIASKGHACHLMRLHDPSNVQVWGLVTGVVRKLPSCRA